MEMLPTTAALIAEVLLSVIGGPTGTLANSGWDARSAASTGMPAARALAAPLALSLPAAAVAAATRLALCACAAAGGAEAAATASKAAQSAPSCMLAVVLSALCVFSSCTCCPAPCALSLVSVAVASASGSVVLSSTTVVCRRQGSVQVTLCTTKGTSVKARAKYTRASLRKK